LPAINRQIAGKMDRAFTQALYDEAKEDGWTIISMKIVVSKN
jgi:hypothetical protein